tara:strand:+ start:115 stop:435 length:321 start_codon:yes stop_codon:yes gene_type:complete
MQKQNIKKTKQNMMLLRQQYHINPNDEELVDRLIGQRLRFAREVKGMTQTKVAKIISKTFQQVQKNEKGDNSLKVRTLIRMSDKMGFSLKWFFKAFKYKEEDTREE